MHRIRQLLMTGGQPNLILDKSLFQAMPLSAFIPLDRHFHLLIPPILVKEIIGDLTRETNVPNLANRFAVNTTVLPPYGFLVAQALLGADIPLDGRSIPAGLIPVQAGDGKLGHRIVETPEDVSIRRWQKGNFTLSEAIDAYRWQKIKRFINAGHYKKKLAAAGYSVVAPKNLKDLFGKVSAIMANPKLQGTLLGLMHSEFSLPLPQQIQILNRWNKSGKPPMADFAPYAAHCMKANLMLVIGNQKTEILGAPHQHDLRDLEYCYYLPFCEIFGSVDKIHKKLGILLRDDQSFVGYELASDLMRLADEWISMSKDEQIQRNQTLGDRPPDHPDSVVYQLWQKHRPDPKSGIPLPIELLDAKLVGPEGDETTLREIFSKAANRIKEAKPTNADVGDGLFLERSQMVRRDQLEALFPHIDFDKVDLQKE